MPAMEDDSPSPSTPTSPRSPHSPIGSSTATTPHRTHEDPPAAVTADSLLLLPRRLLNVASNATLRSTTTSCPSPSSTYSPSASITMLHTAETLEGLSRQLAELDHSRLLESNPDLTAPCCCGAIVDCPTLAARDRMDAKLKLSGEIGTALLQRYEAMELKYQRAEQQFEIKRKALADSLRHVANLERANTQHLAKYAELSDSYEALEKRHTQSLHNHNLTQQSLAHVRGELTKSRAAANAQGIALATGAATGSSLEVHLADTEQRFDDARTLYQSESRKLRDELKWRSMAEDRIADLEAKLTAAGREVEDIKAARARDAQDLLGNAKERLGALHSELSETFDAEHPSDTPEYLRTLEDLVATNALLKHDTAELARTLADTLAENRSLREEVDELKAVPNPTPRSRPLSMELRPLLTRSHARNHSMGSNSQSVSPRMPGHARGASAAVSRNPAWCHRRDSSLAPSFASTSTTEGPSVTSPSGFTFDDLATDEPTSPDATRNKRASRQSFSGGIQYVHNGVPTGKRSRAVHRRSLTMKSFGVNDVQEPGEDSAHDMSANTSMSEDPGSCAEGDDNVVSASTSDTNSAKRASVLLPMKMTSPRSNDSFLSEQNTFEFPTQQTSSGKPRMGRRTLLLLSRSTGVPPEAAATDHGDASPDHYASSPGEEDSHFLPPLPSTIPELPESPFKQQPLKRELQPKESVPSTPPINVDIEPSETSSMHEVRVVSGSSPVPSIGEVVDFLAKVLVRLRGVDIPTLNRRLKKQNLPTDVGHVSRTTISSLQSEVSDMRHRFRNLQEQSTVTRRELTLLLKLLKDVFSDLLDLQSLVNDVTIDPKLAKKLRREAFEEDKGAPESSGLWGIAAPITNYLFTTPAKAPETVPPPSSRLAPPMPIRAAPKLPASTSASTASVTVFGGSLARRSGPVMPKKSAVNATAVTKDDDVFGSPPSSPSGKRSVSAPMVNPATGSLSKRTVRSRASRSDLMGIFAGAQPPPPPRTRQLSSQYFGGRPTRTVSDGPAGLSTIVDAVLDPADEGHRDVIEQTLRRTRPRGLSDSSIRSTAIGGGFVPPLSPAPPSTALPVSASATATGTTSVGSVTTGGGGVLSTISRRIYSFPFRAPAPVAEETTTPVSAVEPKGDAPSTPTADSQDGGSTSVNTVFSRASTESPDPNEWRDTPRTTSLTIPGAGSAARTTAMLSVSATTTGLSPAHGKGQLLDMLEDRDRQRLRERDAAAPRSVTSGSLPKAVWR